MKMIRWILAPLCCLLSLVCCGSSNDGSPTTGAVRHSTWRSPPGTEPMRPSRCRRSTRRTCGRCAFRPRWPPVVVTAAEVYEQGTRYTGTRFTVEGPEPMTAYVPLRRGLRRGGRLRQRAAGGLHDRIRRSGPLCLGERPYGDPLLHGSGALLRRQHPPHAL